MQGRAVDKRKNGKIVGKKGKKGKIEPKSGFKPRR
jgi:hypothetical protein